MCDLQDWAAVQMVYNQKGTIRGTARTLGISRNTVRKLKDLEGPPEYRRKVYGTKIDEYKERIIKWVEEDDLCGTRIFNELVELGYTGSIGPVYRFLRKLKEREDGLISSKATVRVETPPGDQAQFDWSEYRVPIGGLEKKVYCFSMILAASRKQAICFSLREDADAIYEAIQELFEDLGGVTLELLIDNPKALVDDHNPRNEGEIRYNPHALLLAKHLGVELNACPCYWPRKKGKVERPFRDIEEQFVKGSKFATMEELNRRAKEFVNKWCDRTHGTTKRIPNQHYLQEEMGVLQPLPKTRYRKRELAVRKVSADSFVSIETGKYSVPVKYVDKKVYYRVVYGFRIEIYESQKSEKPFLTVEKSMDKYSVVADESHYEAIAKKVSTSIPQIRREFTQAFPVNGAKYLEVAAKKFTIPTYHARKILELRDMFSDSALDGLVGCCVDRDMLDIKQFRQLIMEQTQKYIDRPPEGTGMGAKNESVTDSAPSECSPVGSGLITADGTEPAAAPSEKMGDPAARDEAFMTRDCSYYEKNVMTEGGK